MLTATTLQVFMMIAALCQVNGGQGLPHQVASQQAYCQRRYAACLLDRKYFTNPQERVIIACILNGEGT